MHLCVQQLICTILKSLQKWRVYKIPINWIQDEYMYKYHSSIKNYTFREVYKNGDFYKSNETTCNNYYILIQESVHVSLRYFLKILAIYSSGVNFNLSNVKRCKHLNHTPPQKYIRVATFNSTGYCHLQLQCRWRQRQ